VGKVIKTIGILSIIVLICFSFFSCGGKNTGGDKKDQVTLVFTSWRTEDIERMDRVNDVFTKAHPNIKIDFQPINDSEYDAQMMAALETGTGADIIFLRSYSSGRNVYDGGYLYVLNNDLPDLKDLPSAAVNAWATEEGKIYGVPSLGVTHGIYYHKEIFDKYGLKEPETWSEFIELCQTLKKNGENVFAQGALDDWTLYEVVFSGLGANFYGGEKSRQALMAGKMKLTDESFLKAFRAIAELRQFLPEGYQGLDYVSMQQMFGTGQAAMFMGGSWEIGILTDLGSTDLGWFAPPVANKGDVLQYCFHVDAGIGINKDTKHFDEAMEYLKWTTTTEFAQLIMNEVPGFYSYTPGDYDLTNSLAKKMINAVDGAECTVRTVWEKMSDQSPSGNEAMGFALPKMMKGEFTPEEAAAYVQEQIDSWYTP